MAMSPMCRFGTFYMHPNDICPLTQQSGAIGKIDFIPMKERK